MKRVGFEPAGIRLLRERTRQRLADKRRRLRRRMEEERADLEGWMAGTEEELKKMERSPTEEVKELTGQVHRIGVRVQIRSPVASPLFL